MYISFDDGKNWKSFQLNLPIVPITDLAIKDNNLIVATQGRGLHIIDDLSVIQQLMNAKSADNLLLKPKDTYRMRGGTRTGSLTQGTNHPNGVMTYFYIKDLNEDDEVVLTYKEANGKVIKSFSTKGKDDEKLGIKTGSNLFVWDMQYDGAERLPGMILWWASLNGPKAIPGEYKVELKVNDIVLEQPFTILADPRAESTLDDMKAQFTFIEDVNKTMDNAHQSIKKIRNINTQLTAFQKQYKDDDAVKDLVEKAKELQKQFTEIEEALYQTKNRSNQDPLNFPIRLTNKLGHLNALVSMGDFAPTSQDIAVKNELSSKINIELNKFNQLLTEEIKAFNEAFNSKNLNYLFVD
jgi:hypothetical protein